jgi:hypothetical protein
VVQRIGDDRTPDAIKMQANILTSIKFPTGALTSYEYGMNKYYSSSGEVDF